ncbi:MAG TPA: thiolase family protein [Candidatus Limnocylindria bacterium]
MSANDSVIVSLARTPIGTVRGSLADVDPLELGTLVVGEAVRRAAIDPQIVDDVILGESLYGGGDIARYAAIEAGIIDASGVAHNRHCASGLAAVSSAAASIRAGMDRVIVAGGTHSSSMMPRVSQRVPGSRDWEPWMSPSHRDTPDAPNKDMSITVGWNTAVKAGITREELDAWALRSHQRAVAAIDADAFVDEILPVGDFAVDEHPRRETSIEKLAALKPLHPEIEGFSITAGNACGANDGAAAMVLMARSVAEDLGLAPLAVVRSWASVGVPPVDTGLAPTIAIPKALGRAGLAISDVALWEINEAFASVSIASTRILGLDDRLVNVLGSGCSLGHPIAASGARMVVTLVHELRRRGGGTGVAAMCAGGGMAAAVVLDVAAAA